MSVDQYGISFTYACGYVPKVVTTIPSPFLECYLLNKTYSGQELYQHDQHDRWHMWSRICSSLRTTWDNPQFLLGDCFVESLVCYVVFYALLFVCLSVCAFLWLPMALSVCYRLSLKVTVVYFAFFSTRTLYFLPRHSLIHLKVNYVGKTTNLH